MSDLQANPLDQVGVQTPEGGGQNLGSSQLDHFVADALQQVAGATYGRIKEQKERGLRTKLSHENAEIAKIAEIKLHKAGTDPVLLAQANKEIGELTKLINEAIIEEGNRWSIDLTQQSLQETTAVSTKMGVTVAKAALNEISQVDQQNTNNANNMEEAARLRQVERESTPRNAAENATRDKEVEIAMQYKEADEILTGMPLLELITGDPFTYTMSKAAQIIGGEVVRGGVTELSNPELAIRIRGIISNKREEFIELFDHHGDNHDKLYDAFRTTPQERLFIDERQVRLDIASVLGIEDVDEVPTELIQRILPKYGRGIELSASDEAAAKEAWAMGIIGDLISRDQEGEVVEAIEERAKQLGYGVVDTTTLLDEGIKAFRRRGETPAQSAQYGLTGLFEANLHNSILSGDVEAIKGDAELLGIHLSKKNDDPVREIGEAFVIEEAGEADLRIDKQTERYIMTQEDIRAFSGGILFLEKILNMVKRDSYRKETPESIAIKNDSLSIESIYEDLLSGEKTIDEKKELLVTASVYHRDFFNQIGWKTVAGKIGFDVSTRSMWYSIYIELPPKAKAILASEGIYVHTERGISTVEFAIVSADRREFGIQTRSEYGNKTIPLTDATMEIIDRLAREYKSANNPTHNSKY